MQYVVMRVIQLRMKSMRYRTVSEKYRSVLRPVNSTRELFSILIRTCSSTFPPARTQLVISDRFPRQIRFVDDRH
jgi:hypothetical protein